MNNTFRNINKKKKKKSQIWRNLEQSSKPRKHLLVFKTSWRRLQDMFWRCLQYVLSVTIFRLPKRLEDVLQKRLEEVLKTSCNTSKRRFKDVLQDVWEDEKLLRWRRLEDMSWRRLEDMSWRQTKCLQGISVSKHGLLKNLHQHLTNLYLTNLCFTNLRRIQNALIRTQ